MRMSRLQSLWPRTARPSPARTFLSDRTKTYTSTNSGKSRHATFYSDLVPAMIPVALLGSALYLGLRLLQASLAHEKYLDQAREQVTRLEAEVAELWEAQRAHSGRGSEVSLPSQTTGRSRWRFW